MPTIEPMPELDFLSGLYFSDVSDSPSARMLVDYPSSNSTDTIFQNRSQFIIHDPFPPPPAELLKVLGPHHLMCCWGSELPITSQAEPPKWLLDHWQRIFGHQQDQGACLPDWRPFSFEDDVAYATLFPHQSIPAGRQLIAPEINYELHSKEVIERIDSPQAEVLDAVKPPCVVKLSHGYAGLGNFFIRNQNDRASMQLQLERHWPDAKLVINSLITDIVDDFGVQFYLRKNGTIVWLGLTQQRFNSTGRWCGGVFSQTQQVEMLQPLESIMAAAGEYLAGQGYFGVVGIDILRNADGEMFLVDVNPRLTGVTPFLMASRIFAKYEHLHEGVYRASCRFSGSCEQLVAAAEGFVDARVLILSGYEDSDRNEVICHVSVSSESQVTNERVFDELLGSDRL